MRAGTLRERVTLQKRATQADDGFGNTLAAFSDQFTVAASIVPMRGDEQILAARLQGVRAVTITVRQSSNADQITAEWRVVDARSGEIYNIRSVEPDVRNRRIAMLCELGVTT